MTNDEARQLRQQTMPVVGAFESYKSRSDSRKCRLYAWLETGADGFV